jgi:hypothetical protein
VIVPEPNRVVGVAKLDRFTVDETFDASLCCETHSQLETDHESGIENADDQSSAGYIVA